MKETVPLRLPLRKRVFPNGATLLFTPNPTTPTVSVAAFCDAGVLCEPEERAGLANLASLLLDEGSRRRSGEALVEELESVGGHLEAGPSGASLGVPAEELGRGLRVLSEVLIEPAFPDEAVRKKRELVLSEILADEDDPKTKALDQFREMVYGGHPLHRPATGYRRTVSRIRRGDLVAFHRRFFAPERLILGIAGDVPFHRVERLVERTFGRWNHRAAPKPPIPPIPRPSRPPRVKIVSEEREQVNVFLGHVGITRTDPDYYRLLVMDHVLGTGPGFTDRLSRKLRDEQGLAYTVYAGISSTSGKEPGTFSAYIGTSPGKFRGAVKGILRETKEITARPPASEEIRLAKDYLTGSYLFGVERNLGRALFLINQHRFRLGDDYLERYPGMIEAVTPREVLEAARRHIFPDACTIVAVGPVCWR